MFPSAKTSLRLRWIHREIITVFWISPIITTSMYFTFRFEMLVSLEPGFIFPSTAVIFVERFWRKINLGNIELHWHRLAQCICCISNLRMLKISFLEHREGGTVLNYREFHWNLALLLVWTDRLGFLHQPLSFSCHSVSFSVLTYWVAL